MKIAANIVSILLVSALLCQSTYASPIKESDENFGLGSLDNISEEDSFEDESIENETSEDESYELGEKDEDETKVGLTRLKRSVDIVDEPLGEKTVYSIEEDAEVDDKKEANDDSEEMEDQSSEKLPSSEEIREFIKEFFLDHPYG